MPAARRPFSAAALTASFLVVLTTLAGCGDDDDTEPDPDASASPAETESGSSSPSVAEASDEEAVGEVFSLPQAPKAAKTPASRRAYTEFVVERWGYALVTNDADAISDLSPKAGTCRGCQDLAKELQKRRKEGWNVDFPGATVKRVTVEPAGPPQTFDAVATIDIPTSRSYFEDGTFRNDNDAHRNAEFTVQMRWAGGRYLLLSYTLS